MITLPDFLLARISEDEAEAANWMRMDDVDQYSGLEDRVLAECEAKRRLVDYCPSASEHGDDWDTAFWRVLQILALAYADHPDYDEGWKP